MDCNESSATTSASESVVISNTTMTESVTALLNTKENEQPSTITNTTENQADTANTALNSNNNNNNNSNHKNKTTTTTTTTSSVDNTVENLKPEVETGNIEYKLKLVNPTPDRFEHLLSQLMYRIGEGQGEAIYELGVEDDGTAVGLSDEELNASLDTLKEMASRINADLTVLRERNGTNGKVLELLIRKFASGDFSEVRVSVLGNVDSGKSSLLGVLTRGQLDNGRGLARAYMFRHKHEIESGRTSSISQEIMGFDSKGKIVNYNSVHAAMSPNEICELSSKIINFIDLAGHERYLKTTVYGCTGLQPDFCMLMVGANMGIVGMTKEHLGLAVCLKLPVFVVITKIDRAPENVLTETLNDVKKILKSPGSRKLPVVIKSHDDVVVAARNFISERIAPIFQVSNVTGENLDLLRSFLNLLPSKKEWDSVIDKPAQLDIDSTWTVTGAGTVVSGTVMKGVININDNLLLGPDDSGNFLPVQVKSIHTKRLPVKQVRAGLTASVALKKIKKSQIRKGMVLVHPSAKPQPTREFEAEVLVLYHSTTIAVGYEAVVHCCVSQQCARIMEIDKNIIRTGDKAKVRFRFMQKPEFLTVDSKFIFREGRAKGIGRITKLLPFVKEEKEVIVHKNAVHTISNNNLKKESRIIKRSQSQHVGTPGATTSGSTSTTTSGGGSGKQQTTTTTTSTTTPSGPSTKTSSGSVPTITSSSTSTKPTTAPIKTSGGGSSSSSRSQKSKQTTTTTTTSTQKSHK
ncbi:GTP-binding protein 1 [Tieghemostelium lacteum]|uniref:GTP-binding protein 1 n=1 Tax=Tieghemostelium lacteum TaxID=361077 RepID=A0A151Z404_TIELA|nr:GTP-binding protein 1 [Tieghemostelium lacteum]|eukprot:KYQ88647.1 GTP-binding protein 1 [Tieghemostelium lacteum]